MQDAATSMLMGGLVTVGVLAEVNLARVFLADWRRGRRSRRMLRPSTGVAAGATGRSPRFIGSLGACAIVAGVGAGAAVAQDRTSALSSDVPPPAPLTIATDRPSFSDTAGIAPVGHLQLETGYTFTFRDRDDTEVDRHNAPELLARVGLIQDRLEFRASTSGYQWVMTHEAGQDTSTEGFSDVAVGLKLKLCDQDHGVPRLAFEAVTTVGAGSRDISTRHAEPTIKLIWSYDLEQVWGDRWKGVGIGGNLNLAYPTTDGDRFIQLAGSVCVTYALTDKTGLFAEYYVVGPASKGADAAHSVDFGISYLLDPRVQLDARIGCGLNNEADNMFVGTGISFLF